MAEDYSHQETLNNFEYIVPSWFVCSCSSSRKNALFLPDGTDHKALNHFSVKMNERLKSVGFTAA